VFYDDITETCASVTGLLELLTTSEGVSYSSVWGYESSAMWCCVSRQVVSDV